MASAQYESHRDEVPDDLRIVLLGVSGAGKSSTGNAILGRDAFEESRTRESEIQTGRIEDRNISIIDTPGFFNAYLTEEEMKKQMMKCLYLSHPGPHVFLLIINLEHFEEDERNVVKQVQENFGKEALKFTMVLFIGREKVSRAECFLIIESEEMHRILKYFEGRFHVMNSKNENDPYQITMLLKSIDEMVKNNKEQYNSNEIFLKNQRKLRKQAERMKQEEVRKRDMKKHGQEERQVQEQTRGTNQEDMRRERRGYVATKYKDPRDTDAAVKEDLSRTKIESQRERERQRWKLERGMTAGNPSKQDLRIVLLGRYGAGKTATRNTILDRATSRLSFQSSTKICKTKEADVCGRAISITDTPGFYDDLIHNEQLKAVIERYIFTSAPGPHVFLLVINLWSSTYVMQNTVKLFRDIMEEDVLNHTIVLFTSTDWMNWLKYPPLSEYIRTNKDLKSLVDSCGGRYHSFNNKDRLIRLQVNSLLEKIDDLMKRNGGRHYTKHSIFKSTQKKNLNTTKADDRRL